VGVLGLPLKARAVAREASGGKPRRAARGSKVQLRTPKRQPNASYDRSL
jgi:hypothetical protein